MYLHKKTKCIRFLCLALVFILCIPAGQLIINPGTGASMGADAITTSNQSKGFEPQGDTIRSSRATIDRIISDSEVMYAIIAPKNFTNILIPLVNWKTYKGVPAKIFTLESIYANYSTGRDNAENLQKFLRDLDKTSKALTWVLLVGDADIVPIRQLKADAYTKFHLDNFYTSDYYYAGLDSNWDKNNDGVYGDGTKDSSLKFEGDWTPNVYVGRLPVSNTTDVVNCVNDILTYEKSPVSGNWIKRVVLWGGLMDGPNIASGEHQYNSYDTNAYKVKELMVKPIIEEEAPHMLITTRYDYDQLPGGNYNIANDGLYQSIAVSDLNTGATLVNFAGQAYYEGVSLLHYNDPSGTKYIGQSGAFVRLFDDEDAWAATNGKKLPLATFFTCGMGDFSEGEKPGDPTTWKDKTMEQLINSPNGGAIGLVGSTGTTYRGEYENGDSEGNWWMDKNYYEIFFNDTFQGGKALYKMKERYVDQILGSTSSNQEVYKAMLFGYNYQGDPEIDIWTDTPADMKVELFGLWTGPHNITATVTDMSNKPVKNARVCIQNDDIYVYGVTNATGMANIYANPTQMKSVEVVVTAHNFLPINKSLNMGIEPVDLKITPSDIEFSNANPMVNHEITISATIENRGQTALSENVKVRFTLDGLLATGGSKIGADQTIAGLGIGNSKKVSVQWNVTPGEHEIYVEVDPSNDISESYEWNNLASQQLYISRPELYITLEDITITPDPSIEDVYEGTEVELSAKVHNIGESLAENVEVTIEVWQSGVVVPNAVNSATRKIQSLTIATPITLIWTWKPLGGEQEIIIKIDPNKKIPEFNETNNTVSTNITLKFGPEIKPLTDIELNEDTYLENATSLLFYISDEDTKLKDLIITITSSNDNCSVTLNDYFSLDIRPAPDWNGEAIITLNVSDGVKSVSGSFKVTVLPKPDAPRFFEKNFTLYATEDELFKYTIIGYDPDFDTLSFSDDCELFNISSNLGEITFTPTQEHVDNSPYNFTITISDGELTTKHTFSLIVNNAPDPPIISPIPDQFAEVNKTFKLQVHAHDVDSDKIFFYDNTLLFVIDINTGEIEFTPHNKDVGVHKIKIIVSDEDYQTSNITFNLKINRSTEDTPPPANHKPKDSDELFLGEIGGVPVLAILIIIIIVVVIVIILSFMFMRKKKQKGTGKITGTEKMSNIQDDDLAHSESLDDVGALENTGSGNYQLEHHEDSDDFNKPKSRPPRPHRQHRAPRKK